MIINVETFFEEGGDECVLVEDAKKVYPDLEWDKLPVWGMGSKEDVMVMTLRDLLIGIRLKKDGIKWDDVEYSEIEQCVVCRKILLPDDEAYEDARTYNTLCDKHAKYNEKSDKYYICIFP